MVLLDLIEKCKFMLDKTGYAGAILIGRSKEFGAINLGLVVAKVIVYGLRK